MKEELLELKNAIEGYLEEINEYILEYSIKESDQGFLEVIAKAIYYRDQIKKIEEILKDI